jgi:hypothetical protein
LVLEARAAQVAIEPVTEAQARIARQAYRDFGKTSGHPAKLNFGNCFSYALAKTLRQFEDVHREATVRTAGPFTDDRVGFSCASSVSTDWNTRGTLEVITDSEVGTRQ